MTPLTPSRRRFLRDSGVLTASVLAAGFPAGAHAASDDDTIRLALVGCGGRGNGAVRDALQVPNAGPITLHAVADLYPEKANASCTNLGKLFPDKVDVPEERRFIGFQAYQQAIDTLRPGDVVLCTTRCYIRAVHVEYAVRKGINVFMEKPFAPDPAGLKRMREAGRLAATTGSKIAAGLQCRHSPARAALIQRIRDGALGDIVALRANRLGTGNPLKNQGEGGLDLLEQLAFGRNHLLWVGSGQMIDYLIHQIDECCWIKDAWPVSAVGAGGRVPHSTDCGQNLDQYSMEYTFPDGTKAFCGFRRQRGCRKEFATWIHGTKAAGQFSGPIHAADVHMYRDQRIGREHVAWTPEKDAERPWQYEWNHFIHAIRNDLPYNECERAVMADYVSLMGRAACHLGRTVTLDEILASDFAFCDNLYDLTPGSEVPVKPDAEGRFEAPVPGYWEEV